MIELADLVARPFDDALRLVYADQQQRAGDPRGELAIVQDHLRRDPEDAALREREDRLLEEHGDAFLGRFADEYERLVEREAEQALGIAWHLGFIRRARLQVTEERMDEMREPFEELLELSSAALIEHLEVRVRHGWRPGVSLWEYVDRLVELGPRPSLRKLEIGGFGHFASREEERRSYEDIGQVYLDDVGRLWPLYPSLEEVRLQGLTAKIGPELALPALRVFELHESDINSEEIATLERATWPRLERLVLRFGSDHEDRNQACQPDEVARLLASLEARCPRLSHLALLEWRRIDDFLEVLAEEPPVELLSRLRGLDLSENMLDASDVRRLLELRPHLGGLEWLEVDNHLEPESLAALRAAWPACAILDGGQDSLPGHGKLPD